MLPPGHIAGAYLTTLGVIAVIDPAISHEQWVILLCIGMLFGFAPDLDFFYAFIKHRTLTASEEKFNHREFLSHVPILWLIAGLIVAFVSSNPFWKMIGLLVWTGSWTHFLLDSIESGVMWLWPWKKKQYALIQDHQKFITKETRFFPFWISFTKWYAMTFVSFWLELGVIAIAAYVFIKQLI